MSGLSVVAWTLAIVMVAISVYCVGRLVVARQWSRQAEPDVDAAHAIKGLAMAGMLVGGFRLLPAGVWAVVFAAITLWFGWRITVRVQSGSAARLHHLPHLLGAGAMVYMLLDRPSTAGGGMQGMAASPTQWSVLTLALAVVLFGSAIWALDRLPVAATGVTAVTAGTGSGPATGSGGGVVLAPRLASCCQIALSVTMGYMLIMML